MYDKKLMGRTKNAHVLLQRLKCLRDKDCEHLAYRAGRLMGNLFVNGRHALKDFKYFMKNLKEKGKSLFKNIKKRIEKRG